MSTRGPYRLKRRAETQAETRRRIVEATVDLHRTLGPARTTISAIAERAGVQRLTVYRHFPDERSLLLACSGLFETLHPPPDPKPWRAIVDPYRRLEVGLTAVYAFFAETSEMWTSVLRDAEVHAPTRAIVRERGQFLIEIRDVLVEAFRSKGRPRDLVPAAIAHAVDFHTWQSLVETGGLTAPQAVDLMGAMVRRATGARASARLPHRSQPSHPAGRPGLGRALEPDRPKPDKAYLRSREADGGSRGRQVVIRSVRWGRGSGRLCEGRLIEGDPNGAEGEM
jgi:AcrR family transcriptional regulator